MRDFTALFGPKKQLLNLLLHENMQTHYKLLVIFRRACHMCYNIIFSNGEASIPSWASSLQYFVSLRGMRSRRENTIANILLKCIMQNRYGTLHLRCPKLFAIVSRKNRMMHDEILNDNRISLVGRLSIPRARMWAHQSGNHHLLRGSSLTKVRLHLLELSRQRGLFG